MEPKAHAPSASQRSAPQAEPVGDPLAHAGAGAGAGAEAAADAAAAAGAEPGADVRGQAGTERHHEARADPATDVAAAPASSLANSADEAASLAPAGGGSVAPAAAPTADPELADADSALPEELRRLERRFVAYSLVHGLLSCLVLYGLLTALVLFLVQRLPDYAQWIWITAVVGAALLAVWTVVAPPLAYARWRYGMNRELLLVRHGILWHEERTIPISRMQHVDLSRGPLERWFGLATLVVFTAGSEAASVRVPGLAVPVAGELRDRILEARGTDVV